MIVNADELEGLLDRWHRGSLDSATLVKKLEGIVSDLRKYAVPEVDASIAKDAERYRLERQRYYHVRRNADLKLGNALLPEEVFYANYDKIADKLNAGTTLPSPQKPTEWCKSAEFGCECGRPDTEPCPLPHPRDAFRR